MAINDTRNFAGSRFNVSAAPFATAYDYSVYDHLKYIGISKAAFAVPATGSVEISSTIQASTPGTQPGRVIHGVYTATSAPYAEPTLEGQLAGAVMNVIDFATARNASGSSADYFLDEALVAHVDHVGVPLDAQGRGYTGIYPSLGAGEELASKINYLVIGHGLFSLLDAFPFQHPEAPELSVSIPLSERAFGQGAIASFDDFKVKTTTMK